MTLKNPKSQVAMRSPIFSVRHKARKLGLDAKGKVAIQIN